MRLWPWPSKRERKQRVVTAVKAADRASAAARRAEALAADLRRIQADKLGSAIMEGLQAGPEDR